MDARTAPDGGTVHLIGVLTQLQLPIRSAPSWDGRAGIVARLPGIRMESSWNTLIAGVAYAALPDIGRQGPQVPCVLMGLAVLP